MDLAVWEIEGPVEGLREWVGIYGSVKWTDPSVGVMEDVLGGSKVDLVGKFWAFEE